MSLDILIGIRVICHLSDGSMFRTPARFDPDFVGLCNDCRLSRAKKLKLKNFYEI